MSLELTVTRNNGYLNCYESLHVSENSEKKVRGERAVTEMMNRPGLVERIDQCLGNQSHNPADYQENFVAKIRQNQNFLQQPASQQDFKRFAHRVFDIYQKEVVEQVYKNVENNPLAWTFSKEEWKHKKLAFKDFVWTYVKTTWSGAANFSITEAMKAEFPILPKEFWPAVYSVIDPFENDFIYPEN